MSRGRMDDGASRLVLALVVLVAVWVVVYWSYEPREAGVTLDASEPAAISAETSRPLLIPEDPVLRNAAAEPPPVRIPRPEPRVPEAPAEGQAASVGVREGGVVPPAFERYTVRPGDTFETIARQRYGTVRLWTAVARANPRVDPLRLRAGQEIRLPVDPSNVQGVPEDGIALPERAEAVAVEYVVRPGDTLSEIAAEVYGSAAARYVDLLFEANRDRLRSRSSIRVGQTLIIPPPPAGDG